MRALAPAIAAAALALDICAPGWAQPAEVSPVQVSSGKPPLIWSDEFEGRDLDPQKWTIEQDCWGGGNQERQCYTGSPANVSVSGGLLRITARHEGARGPSLRPDQGAGQTVAREFTSARIETKGLASFRYGRIEVRARLAGGQGLWPAIWLLPEHDNYGPFPRSGEIDIAEAVNLGVRCLSCRSEVHGAVHYGRNLKRIRSAEGVAGLKPDLFHTFALEWTPKRMTWSVDGRRFFSRATRKPFDERFHLILNLAVGGRWPEAVGKRGVDARALPATMLVDWVHVYGPKEDYPAPSSDDVGPDPDRPDG